MTSLANLQKNSRNATFAVRHRFMPLAGCLVASAIAFPAMAATGSVCENPDVLRFSLIPEQGAERQSDKYAPLIAELEGKTGKRIELVRPTSYGSVVDGLVNGRLDLAMLGPAAYVAARLRDPGITPFVSHEKLGGAFHEAGNFYRSVLITRADSRFGSLDQLRGWRLALTDPGSTSGALLPRQHFGREEAPRLGVPFERFFGSIGYAGDHRRAVLAVTERQVDAAYVADDVISSVILEGRIKADALRVIWRSAPIRRDPYVYRQALCESLRKKIRDAFLALNADEQNAALLPLGIVRFRPVSDDDYQLIYQLFPASVASPFK